MAKTYVVTFRSHNDDRPSKFIVAPVLDGGNLVLVQQLTVYLFQHCRGLFSEISSLFPGTIIAFLIDEASPMLAPDPA